MLPVRVVPFQPPPLGRVSLRCLPGLDFSLPRPASFSPLVACSGRLYDDGLPPLSLFSSLGLRVKNVLICVGCLRPPLVSRTSSRNQVQICFSCHTGHGRSVPLIEGCFLRCYLVFGAAFALKILCDLPRSATFGSQKHG